MSNQDMSFCDICKILLPVKIMDTHINGKKHMKAAKNAEPLLRKEENNTGTSEDTVKRTKKCDVCNVFVPVTAMNDHKHLEKLNPTLDTKASDGAIAGSSNDVNEIKEKVNSKETNMCNICEIPINIGNMEEHIKGKKHQYILRKMEEVARRNRTAIKVTDYPADVPIDALLQYFRQFGRVEYHYLGHNYVVVFYKNPFKPENVLERVHFFNNKVLTVQQYNIDDQKESRELDLDAIARSLKATGNLNQQLDLLINTITPAGTEEYRMLCQHLEIALKTVFNTCQVHAFGSTITGLCFKDSDVDVYVQLPDELVRSCKPDELLKKAKKALLKTPVFSKNDIICLYNAKTPIVKCCHVPSRIKCDFNFKNMLGVCNTRLIKNYLSIDSKLTRLMIVLKYWARIHKLNATNKFSNYALTMMLIFYLQQPPFNLPSVKMLQTNCVFEQEGWNGGFPFFCNFRSEPLSNISFLELLKGFFDFYMMFDFGLYIICPFLGVKIPKIYFLDESGLSDDFIRYKQYLQNTPNASPLAIDTAVCIQDPFVLSRNLSAVVIARDLGLFHNFCKQSYEICKRGVEDDILYNLFTVTPKLAEISTDTASLRIRIGESLKCFYPKVVNDKLNVSDLRNLWFQTLTVFLLEVFTKVLMFECEDEAAEPPTNKLQRLEGQTDVHDSNDIVSSIVFHFTGDYNLWEQRRSMVKNMAPDLNLPPNCSVLDKEIAVTNLVVGRSIVAKKDRLVDFNLMVTARKDPTLMEFRLDRKMCTASAFHKLCVYFVSHFGALFASHLSQLNVDIECE